MIPAPIKNDIHSGDRTHHQDQSIFPVNFNPTKRTVNRATNTPVKPTPPELPLSLIYITFLVLPVLPLEVKHPFGQRGKENLPFHTLKVYPQSTHATNLLLLNLSPPSIIYYIDLKRGHGR